MQYTLRALSLGQTLSTFHYTLLDKCRALLSVVERGWPNALDFSLDLELNIPRMYYLMNNSFMECFVHYLMNSNCTCARSTTLDNFALDQTSLDKSRALDFTQQGGQTLSTFTQHACRTLYSEKSRAFGQGFKSPKGLHVRRVHTIIICVSPPTAGLLFLAGVSNDLLVPPSATPKILNCSYFTVTIDTMDEATTLAIT